MNNRKTNGYGKLLVFFVVVIILLFSFGLVADGWQKDTDKTMQNINDKVVLPSDKVDQNTKPDDEKEDNTEKAPTENTDKPENTDPVYIDPLTGKITTKELYEKRPMAFIFDPSSPLYGASCADILVEFPTENGKSRFLNLISDERQLGKIGAISQGRDYISAVAKAFGSVLVSYGMDSSTASGNITVGCEELDLTKEGGYHYTEYTELVYTNGRLISSGLYNSNISSKRDPSLKSPFKFSDTEISFEEKISSERIVLSFSEGSTSELTYSELDKKFTLSKGGVAKYDMLNNEILCFDNVFILFCDSLTYETKDSTEIVLNTVGEGFGIYASCGSYTKIKWKLGDNGELSLFRSDGEELLINQGKSYIGYMKSSKISDLTL